MKNGILKIISILILGLGTGAHANDKVETALKNVAAKESVLLKNVTPAGQEQFEKIRTAHGTLRAVEDVQSALDRAIKNCVKHHKVQGFTFQNQFQAWKNDVLPVVRQGQNRLDKMVLTQNFAAPTDVQNYLKSYTAAVQAQQPKINEIPVSDLTACQAMVDQLKDTKKIMAGMIKETIGLE